MHSLGASLWLKDVSPDLGEKHNSASANDKDQGRQNVPCQPRTATP